MAQPNEIHTATAISAAKEISKLIKLPTSLSGHSHFFSCVVTVAAIVHLCQWTLISEADDTSIKEEIKLDVGALKKCANVWPLSRTVLNEVKKVAEELFALKRARGVSDDSSGDGILQDIAGT